MNSFRPVVCLVGPTGTGKSAIAIRLAACFDGVVINADSRQVYRDFPIITAQPTAEEQSRIPHRLYGFLDTRERISAGLWAGMAKEIISRTLEEGKLPILTGGTGLYLRALLDGMADIPPVPIQIDRQLENECRTQGLAALHELLAGLDPVCAARIHPHDRQRTLRALAVYRATGRPLSWWQQHTPQPPAWNVLRLALGLPLAELTPLLARRIRSMIRQGAKDEATRALELCPDGSAPGWSGIGCAELYDWLRGTLDDAALVATWTAHTRAYAKRQLTWFRADHRLQWFSPDSGEKVRQRVEEFLSGKGRAWTNPVSDACPAGRPALQERQ